MRNKMIGLLAGAAIVVLSAVPLHSAQAQPWGFNMFGMSVGQNWGWGGPWGYPGWGRRWGGYPHYGGWGYPGWGGPWGGPWGGAWGAHHQRPVIIIQPTVQS